MYYFGIDISKLTFDVTVLTDNKNQHRIFKNNPNGYKLFTKWVKSHNSKTIICMEATGVYGIALAKYLCQQSLKTIVANPFKIHSYSAMQMNRNKTDKADSLCIAKYCRYLNQEENINKNLYQPKSKYYQQLQSLVTRLDQLMIYKTQESNRLESCLDNVCKKSINLFIKQLEKQVELLLSINGIGEKTAWAILAYLGDISLFDKASQVASYSGTNPSIKESGTSLKSTRISKMGNKKLRKSLYMPAIVAKKYNPILAIFYDKLIAKGKPKKVAICAVMRKLLIISYGVLKSEQKFNPAYKNTQN